MATGSFWLGAGCCTGMARCGFGRKPVVPGCRTIGLKLGGGCYPLWGAPGPQASGAMAPHRLRSGSNPLERLAQQRAQVRGGPRAWAPIPLPVVL